MIGWGIWSCPPFQANGRVLIGFRGGQISGDGLMCQRVGLGRIL